MVCMSPNSVGGLLGFIGEFNSIISTYINIDLIIRPVLQKANDASKTSALKMQFLNHSIAFEFIYIGVPFYCINDPN